jgi:hypothetical protein
LTFNPSNRLWPYPGAVARGPVGAITTTISRDEHGSLVEHGNHEQLFDTLDVMIVGTEIRSRSGLTAQERNSANAKAKNISLFQSTLEYEGSK